MRRLEWWDRREIRTCSRRTRAARQYQAATALADIYLPAPPPVICRIEINNHARRPMLLRDKNFNPAEVLAVAHHNDLAAHIDLHLLELVEVFGRTVVGINHFGLDIS